MPAHSFDDFALIPLPHELNPQPGELPLDGGFDLVIDDSARHEGVDRVCDQLTGWLAESGVEVRRRSAPYNAHGCTLTLDLNSNTMPTAAYRLEVSRDSVLLSASDRTGLFYAAQTLRQLVASAHDGRLRCVEINDDPRFAWRGFMLDSARHYQPVDWIKCHLDRMASLKMNRLHWHLSDDQSWRAEIKRYPRLTEVASWPGAGDSKGFYSQQEMREVVAYAAELQIAVIPEIDTPAHCNAALVAYPELSCDGQPLPVDEDAGWEAFTAKAGRRAFCAGQDETFEFLHGVWSELAELFDPLFLHLGGDETPDKAWHECPKCGALREKLGTDNAGLRHHFMKRLADFCQQELGYSTIGWTEGVSDQIPRGQMVHAWFPHEAGEAARLGYHVINSNHEWTYIDYPANDEDSRHRPDWMMVLPLEKVYHFDPVPDGLAKEHRDRIVGSELAMWSESLPDAAALEKQIMPRLLAFAEIMWTPRLRCGLDGFQRRLRLWQKSARRPKMTAPV